MGELILVEILRRKRMMTQQGTTDRKEWTLSNYTVFLKAKRFKKTGIRLFDGVIAFVWAKSWSESQKGWLY
jgi:hypothetical protein